MAQEQTDAYRTGYNAGLRYFTPALLDPPDSAVHRTALQSAFWRGGIACAEAGYAPTQDQQGADEFFQGFLDALADAEDEAEHI